MRIILRCKRKDPDPLLFFFSLLLLRPQKIEDLNCHWMDLNTFSPTNQCLRRRHRSPEKHTSNDNRRSSPIRFTPALTSLTPLGVFLPSNILHLIFIRSIFLFIHGGRIPISFLKRFNLENRNVSSI